MLQRKLTHFVNIGTKTDESELKKPRTEEFDVLKQHTKESLPPDEQKSLKSEISPKSPPLGKEKPHKTFAESKEELLKMDHADLAMKLFEKVGMNEWPLDSAPPELMQDVLKIVEKYKQCEDLLANEHIYCRIINLFKSHLCCPNHKCKGKLYPGFGSKRYLIKCTVCAKVNPCKLFPQIPFQVFEVIFLKFEKEQLIQLFVTSGLLDGCRWRSMSKVNDEAELEDFIFDDFSGPLNSVAYTPACLNSERQQPTGTWRIVLPRKAKTLAEMALSNEKPAPQMPKKPCFAGNNPFSPLCSPINVKEVSISNSVDSNDSNEELLRQIAELKTNALLMEQKIKNLQQIVENLQQKPEAKLVEEVVVNSASKKKKRKKRKAPKQRSKEDKPKKCPIKKQHPGFESIYVTGVKRGSVTATLKKLQEVGVDPNLALDVSFIGGQLLEIVTIASFANQLKDTISRCNLKSQKLRVIDFNPLEEQAFRSSKIGVSHEAPIEAFQRRIRARICSLKSRIKTKPALKKLLIFNEELLKTLLLCPQQQCSSPVDAGE